MDLILGICGMAVLATCVYVCIMKMFNVVKKPISQAKLPVDFKHWFKK